MLKCEIKKGNERIEPFALIKFLDVNGELLLFSSFDQVKQMHDELTRFIGEMQEKGHLNT